MSVSVSAVYLNSKSPAAGEGLFPRETTSTIFLSIDGADGSKDWHTYETDAAGKTLVCERGPVVLPASSRS